MYRSGLQSCREAAHHDKKHTVNDPHTSACAPLIHHSNILQSGKSEAEEGAVSRARLFNKPTGWTLNCDLKEKTSEQTEKREKHKGSALKSTSNGGFCA